jgi:hypothetical protein
VAPAIDQYQGALGAHAAQLQHALAVIVNPEVANTLSTDDSEDTEVSSAGTSRSTSAASSLPERVMSSPPTTCTGTGETALGSRAMRVPVTTISSSSWLGFLGPGGCDIIATAAATAAASEAVTRGSVSCLATGATSSVVGPCWILRDHILSVLRWVSEGCR